jgi:hypothetical protein
LLKAQPNFERNVSVTPSLSITHKFRVKIDCFCAN